MISSSNETLTNDLVLSPHYQLAITISQPLSIQIGSGVTPLLFLKCSYARLDQNNHRKCFFFRLGYLKKQIQFEFWVEKNRESFSMLFFACMFFFPSFIAGKETNI